MDEDLLAALLILLMKRLNLTVVDVTQQDLEFTAALFFEPVGEDNLRLTYTDTGSGTCQSTH